MRMKATAVMLAMNEIVLRHEADQRANLVAFGLDVESEDAGRAADWVGEIPGGC